MLIVDDLRRSPKQVRYVAKIRVQVGNIQEGLGGTLAGAHDFNAQAFLTLEVLDGLHVVAVAGDEYVSVGVVGQAYHVYDDANVPVALVRNDPLAFGGDGLVDGERLGAHLITELVEIVDKR